MKELKFSADLEQMPKVLKFVGDELDKAGCARKARIRIEIALEEIFVNIAKYAYKNRQNGDVTVRMSFPGNEASVEITFIDGGTPFNPLEKPDPDIKLPAEKREIGGLGIWLVKEYMDMVQYHHEDGHNILTIRRKIKE